MDRSPTIVLLFLALSGCATQTLPENNAREKLTPVDWKNEVAPAAQSTVDWSSKKTPPPCSSTPER